MQKRIEKFTDEFEFLSNHFKSTIGFEGIVYPTVTHAYQSLKLKNQCDRSAIAKFDDPRGVVGYARKCETVGNWSTVSQIVMLELLVQKFKNPFLREKLLNTGDSFLGDGRNFVGSLLMKVREQIRNESLS
jgi:predicted NAD-dependent protein-ADP-ribosyltransferase YbiA (DUF1768 family)